MGDDHELVSQGPSKFLYDIVSKERMFNISFPDTNDETYTGSFESIGCFKSNHIRDMLIWHYNINNMRNKFCEISLMFLKYDNEFLVIWQTKSGFTSVQFM